MKKVFMTAALATVLAWYAVHAWLMRRRMFFKV